MDHNLEPMACRGHWHVSRNGEELAYGTFTTRQEAEAMCLQISQGIKTTTWQRFKRACYEEPGETLATIALAIVLLSLVGMVLMLLFISNRTLMGIITGLISFGAGVVWAAGRSYKRNLWPGS